jgi:hypothetical protein
MGNTVALRGLGAAHRGVADCTRQDENASHLGWEDRNMRLIAFAVGTLIAVSPAAAEGWKEYSYSGYSFSVSFPADPKIETTSYQDADGRSAEAHVYSVTQGNAVLKVTVADLPDARAMRTLAMRGEIKFSTRQRIGRVFGRNLSIAGTDGSHSTVAVFFYMGRLYEIEGTPLGDNANADVLRFTQSLVFTDKANATWPQVVERFRGECRRQFQNLRGPGQAEAVRDSMRDCVLEKIRAETGRNFTAPVSTR